jgi:putative lipoprotein
VRRAFLLLACVCVARPALADDWTGRDKALHFGYSLAFGACAQSLVLLGSSQRSWRQWLLGAGIGFTPGLAKEAWDATGHGDPSLRDLAWDATGSLTGALLTWAVVSLAVPVSRTDR